jgi:hypothetical protein
MELQAINDLQATIDGLDVQIGVLQNQKQELEQKIQNLRLITDRVDIMDNSAVMVKQAVGYIYDAKADVFHESLDKVLDDKQKELIRSYATKDLIAPVAVAANMEDIKGG